MAKHEFDQVTDFNRNGIQFIVMNKSIGVRAFGDDKMCVECRVLIFYIFPFCTAEIRIHKQMKLVIEHELRKINLK